MRIGPIPYASAVYQDDIDEAVVKVQKATGVFINKAWWDANVGDQGTREEILNRFDDAYAKYIESLPDKEPNVLPGEIEALPQRSIYSETTPIDTTAQDLPTQNTLPPDNTTLPPPI